MADPLRVLYVEDVDSDPLLLIDELERGGYEPLWRRVDSIEDFESALSESWDIVIADDRVPLTPLHVLQALRDRQLDVPLIVLSAELNLDKLAQGVTDAATELSGAQLGAFFYNVDDERGERYTLYALSGALRGASSRIPMPRNPELFGAAFRGETAVRADDVRK